MRIMRFAAASRRWPCRTRLRGSTTRACRSGSACTPVKWWCRPSKTVFTRPTTPPAPTCISPTAWSSWRTTGCILITRDTYVAAKQFVEVEPLGPQTVRGIAAPVEAFKLTGLLNAPASDVFRSGRRLSSLIGRSDQFAALEPNCKYALQATAGWSASSARPGIGKSRLCFEFAEHCRRQGIRVYEGRVLAHARATPFQPVLELLRDVFGIQGQGFRRGCRAAASSDRLAALSSSEQTLLLLLEFLGLSDAARPAPKLDPRALKMQLLDLVRTLVRSAPRDTATVVRIEDLHWIDAASEEFVEALADVVVGTTTLLVVNFRPGFAASLMQRSHYRQIVMPPLPAEPGRTAAASSIAATILRSRSLSRNIIERAQGNPFFLEELVKAIVERGDFEGERGAYRLKGGIDTIPLPSTVQAVIAARIDRLDDIAKQVLETASVIGRVVSLSVLQRVTAMPHDELSDAIWQLRQADLLYDFPPFDQGLLAFRHPLIQEVAYATQLRSRLIMSHAAVAKAIECFDWGKLDEFAGLLAFHYEAAGQTLDAITHLERSARWIGQTNSAEGLKSWKKVRSLLQDQPRSEHNDRLRALRQRPDSELRLARGHVGRRGQALRGGSTRYARTATEERTDPARRIRPDPGGHWSGGRLRSSRAGRGQTDARASETLGRFATAPGGAQPGAVHGRPVERSP